MTAGKSFVFITVTLLAITIGFQSLDLGRKAEAQQQAMSAHDNNIISHIGGRMSVVAVNGNIGYVGIGSRISSLDLSQPDTITELARTNPLDGVIRFVGMANGYLYALTENYGLHVFDNVSTPVQLHEVSYLAIEGNPNHFAVSGHLLYLVDGYGLHIIDISTPTTLREVSYLWLTQGTVRVRLHGNTAFVAAMSEIYIVDVANPRSPRVIGMIEPVETGDPYQQIYQDVAIKDGYAYVGDVNHGIDIFDIGDLTQPRYSGSVNGLRGFSIAVHNNFLYLNAGWSGMYVFDLVTPHAPQEIAHTYGAGGDMTFEDEEIFLISPRNQLMSYDISAPENALPMLRQFSAAGSAHTVSIVGQYALSISGNQFNVTDISDPLTPVVKATRDVYGCNGLLVVSGDRAFVNNYDGFAVFDIQDITNPRLVASVRTRTQPSAIVVDGNVLYAAVRSGIEVYSLDQGASPALIHFISIDDAQSLAGLAIKDAMLFIAANRAGVKIIDVSEPSAARIIHTISVDGYARIVDFKEDYLAIIDSQTGLTMYDIDDPDNPIALGTLNVPGFEADIKIRDNFAYIAAREHGVRIVDLTDVTDIREIGYIRTSGQATRVDIDGDYIYIADLNGGMLIALLPWAIEALPHRIFLPLLASSAPDGVNFADEVVRLTNIERARVNCIPLRKNVLIQQAAYQHSRSMALDDFYSHTGIDGSTPFSRISATGLRFQRSAENIAHGQSAPAQVVEAWMNSPGHRANILNCNLEEIGVGYYYLENDEGWILGNHYWTQKFVVP